MFLRNSEKPHMFGIYNAAILAEEGIEGIISSYSGKGYEEANRELNEFSLSAKPITIIQHPEFKNKSGVSTDINQVNIFEGNKNGSTIIAKITLGNPLLAIHYLIKNKSLLENKFGANAAKIWHDTFGKRMELPDIQKINSQFGFTFTVNDNPFIPMDNIYLSPEFGYIRVEGLADDVESAVKFLNKQMLKFIPTREEFEKAKGNLTHTSFAGHSNKSKILFESKLNSIIYEEKASSYNKNELTYDSFIEFGKEYFIPSNMIISVVSSLESGQIQNLFEPFVGEVSSYKENRGVIKSFKDIDKSIKFQEDEGGEQSYLYYGFLKKVEEIDKAALKILSLLLSDNIIFNIREKQGLAYRMSAGIDVRDNNAMFFINMGTRSENVNKLIPQFSNFFSQEFSNEISQSAIKKSVNMYLGRMMFRRLSSINQAYYLAYSKYFYNDIFHDKKSLEILKEVNDLPKRSKC